MANFYAVGYTNTYNNVPTTMLNAYNKDVISLETDVYEASSTASGSVLYFFKLPKGRAIVGGNLRSDALGSSVTLSVGTPAAATRYLAATASNTANLTTALTVAVDDFAVPFTAETEIVVTVGGAAATGTIKLELHTIAA